MIGGAMGSGIDVAIGGALLGFAVKQGWVQKLPAVPLLGRTGTAAILLHFWAKRGGGPWVAKAANAAAVVAGYQLGSTGAITGDHLQTSGLQSAGEGESYGYETDGDDDDDD